MRQVTKSEFFEFIGPKDVVVSCNYQWGDKEIKTQLKTRSMQLVGETVQKLPLIDTTSTQFFLA